MARLGFCGLGIMGAPMAQNLHKAGHEVAVWSHTAGKAQAFSHAYGATSCASPAQVAKASECVFLCVGDTAMAREVILGDNGLKVGAQPGFAIVDCSTIAPADSVRIAEVLMQSQIGFLDAPCSGSKAGAEGGTLTFMVGGPKPLFDRAQPFLEAMGKSFYYCGEQGMGLRAKLTQNLILGNLLQAFNEGFVLSTKAGVDPEVMLDILNNSAARSGSGSGQGARCVPARFCHKFFRQVAGERHGSDGARCGRNERASAADSACPSSCCAPPLQKVMAKKIFADPSAC